MKTQKSDFLSTTAGVLTAAVAANLLWGSASPCIKLGYQFFQVGSTEVMSQILFAGVRFFLAGVLTILMGSLLRGRVLRPERGSGGMILALAMMQTVIQYSFFYIGLSKAPGFKGSITSPTSTFFAILIASLIRELRAGNAPEKEIFVEERIFTREDLSEDLIASREY